MSRRKEDVLFEYSRKLRELDFLWSNPLRPFSSYADLGGSKVSERAVKIDYLTGADIRTSVPISLTDSACLKRDLATAASSYLSICEENGDTRKRTGEDTSEVPRKAQKTTTTDFPSRLMPASRIAQDGKAVSKNLQSQIASLEHETNAYLNRKISDLDIVALPEHLPTEVHNVVSLAELYYVTQTLPLIKLLPGTHKTLMTENFESAILEGKVAVLFSRIEELKRSKKWSLRQPVRYYDPFVYAKRNKKTRLLAWDHLLREGKWVAADFKESSKYKKLCCVTMARAVQDFWTYGKVVCVKRRDIQYLSETPTGTESALFSLAVDAAGAEKEPRMADSEETEEMQVSPNLPNDPVANSDIAETPEVAEPEPESIDISKLLERPNPADEITPLNLPVVSPQELLNAGVNVRNRGPFRAHVNINEMKKIDQSIVRNLPKFTAFDEPSRKPIPTGETSIIPVSRMLYPMEEDDEWHKIVLREPKSKPVGGSTNSIPEYQKGLFGVQSHRRLNFLRPPKPPLIKNIEFRSPTIWLPHDDKLLIHYVAEYCFNWDLIAENLPQNVATLKRYESNIERRTPWQCFERYIQLNEKFQFSDMKGLNAYSAQQWLEHAHKAQSTTKRRISPLGVGNESIQRGHRRLRWASMFDAMRKTMRKRETAAAKASTRKNTASPDVSGTSSSSNGSAVAKRDKMPSPAELSKLKFERDKTIQEAYLHQQATRSKMLAAVSQQKRQESPSGSSPGAGGPTDTGVAGGGRRSQGVSQGVPGPGRVPGSALSSPSMPRQQAPGSQVSNPQTPNGNKPMANYKRPTTPNGTPLTVEQIQRLLQIQKQRRMMQGQASQGQASQNPLTRKTMGQVPIQGLTPGGLTAGGVGGSSGNPASSANLPSSANPANPANSPNPSARLAKPARGRIQFPPAQVSAIINSIQQKNPNLSKDQVTKLAASYLANLQQQQQNKLEQQNRPATAGESSSAQNLQARQAQLSRQRLAAQSSGAGKEAEAQTLSKMQYEERKKLMMQQGGSQYGQGSGKPAGKGTKRTQGSG